MESKSNLRVAMTLLRGAAVFAIFFFMRAAILFLTASVSLDKDTQIYADIPLWAIGLIVLIGSLLLYNSLVRLFTLYDKPALDAFLEDPRAGRRFAEYGAILKSRDYLIESTVPVALAALILPFGVFYETEMLFAFAGSARYLIIYPLYFTAFLFSGMNARYETHRHWQHLYERRELASLDSKWKFFFKLILIILIYPFAIPLSPVLLFVIYNFFSVLYALAGYLSIIGVVLTIVLILFLVLVIPKLRVLAKRRRFIKKLSAIADRSDYVLEDLRIERSLRIGLAGGATFTLKDGDKICSVRLLAIEKRRLPLYFTDERSAHFLYKLGGKKHFVSLARHFEYGVPDEGRRLLVLSPEPKYVFVSSDGAQRRLFTGDRMWQYTVFETDSFFGSMDRHCLDKSVARE